MMGEKEQKENLLIYSVTASGAKALIEKSLRVDDAIEIYLDFKKSWSDYKFDEKREARSKEILGNLEKTLDIKYGEAKEVGLQ